LNGHVRRIGLAACAMPVLSWMAVPQRVNISCLLSCLLAFILMLINIVIYFVESDFHGYHDGFNGYKCNSWL